MSWAGARTLNTTNSICSDFCVPSEVADQEGVKWFSAHMLVPELPLRAEGKREGGRCWEGGSRAEHADNGEVVSLATTALWMVSDQSTTEYEVSD